MKKVLIALGDEELILRQVKELTSFSIKNSLKQREIEFWIISDREIDLSKVEFPKWIKNIVYYNSENLMLAENFLEVLKEIFLEKQPKLLIFGSDNFSSGISTRFSSFIKGGSLNFIKKLEIEDEEIYAVKQVYSSNMTAKFKFKRNCNCISIDKGFKEEYEVLSEKIVVEKKEKKNREFIWIKEHKLEKKEVTESIEEQNFVIVVGKGIGSLENVDLVEGFAKKFNGKIGATRPVIMNGWIQMDSLVGVSGHFISPEICLVLGASGQGAFTSGIMNSKKIIAVNIDKNAPILKQSDIVIPLDYKVFLKKMLERANEE